MKHLKHIKTFILSATFFTSITHQVLAAKAPAWSCSQALGPVESQRAHTVWSEFEKLRIQKFKMLGILKGGSDSFPLVALAAREINESSTEKTNERVNSIFNTLWRGKQDKMLDKDVQTAVKAALASTSQQLRRSSKTELEVDNVGFKDEAELLRSQAQPNPAKMFQIQLYEHLQRVPYYLPVSGIKKAPNSLVIGLSKENDDYPTVLKVGGMENNKKADKFGVICSIQRYDKPLQAHSSLPLNKPIVVIPTR